jgi:hypothetical protein
MNISEKTGTAIASTMMRKTKFPALVLLVHQRAVEAQQRCEHERCPQQARRDQAGVETAARGRDGHHEHDHREQRVEAHRGDHLAGAQLHHDVLAQDRDELTP